MSTVTRPIRRSMSLGALVKAHQERGNSLLRTADLGKATEALLKLDKEGFLRKVAYFAKSRMNTDISKSGYVVVHPDVLPPGVKLDREVDRVFCSPVVERNEILFIEAPMGEVK